jgi:hypothetical protein
MEAFPHGVTALNPATNVSKNDVAGLPTISLRQIVKSATPGRLIVAA